MIFVCYILNITDAKLYMSFTSIYFFLLYIKLSLFSNDVLNIAYFIFHIYTDSGVCAHA